MDLGLSVQNKTGTIFYLLIQTYHSTLNQLSTLNSQLSQIMSQQQQDACLTYCAKSADSVNGGSAGADCAQTCMDAVANGSFKSDSLSTICVSGIADCPPGNIECLQLQGKCVRAVTRPEQSWRQELVQMDSFENIMTDCVGTGCDIKSVNEGVIFASVNNLNLDQNSDDFSGFVGNSDQMASIAALGLN